VSPAKQPTTSHRTAILGALTLLYAAQGIPFGFAAEYLPVVLRQAGLSRTVIASFSSLQVPWQLKPLWAGFVDLPSVRQRARFVLLSLQFLLAVVMASYALIGGRDALVPWAVITFIAAFIAATQDIFVDAFAVRSLASGERGWGNSAQVAGYRLGISMGGGGMLALSGIWGSRLTLFACAGVIALTALAAFVLRTETEPVQNSLSPYRKDQKSEEKQGYFTGLRSIVAHQFQRSVLPVTAVAVTYKLGIHAASGLVKPMLVDAHWTVAEIGLLVVTLGAGSSIVGSLLGGVLHRWLGEVTALRAGMVFHGIAVVPLVFVVQMGCPRGATALALAVEHAASGMGTTLLFAALMTATQRDRAALHYTVLTSFNALAILIGSGLGALLGDTLGEQAAFGISALLCLLPWPFLHRWTAHAEASARIQNT
jgi:MFS transporter, PAT family, beta-lactamase induction signal transducer AmpG